MSDGKQKNPNIFEIIKIAQEYAKLAIELQNIDANKNNIKDGPELLGLVFQLKDEAEEAHEKIQKCQDTIGKITDLVGDDIEEIRKRFGIEAQPA